MIKQGEIYEFDLGGFKDHITGKKRPVYIISNNIANKFCPTIQICAVSTKKKNLPQQIEIHSLKKVSYVQCEQIHTIPKKLLGKKICECTKMEKARVCQGLMLQLGGIL